MSEKQTIDEITACLLNDYIRLNKYKNDLTGYRKEYERITDVFKSSLLNLLVEGLPKEYNIFDDETVPTEDGRRLVNNTIKWCRANIERLIKGGK